MTWAGKERRCGEDVSATVRYKRGIAQSIKCLAHSFMNEIWHGRARSQGDRDSSGMLLFIFSPRCLCLSCFSTHQTFDQFCSPSHRLNPLEEFFSPLHTLGDEFFDGQFLQNVGEMRENVLCSDTLGFAHNTGFDVPGHCMTIATENGIFENFIS